MSTGKLQYRDITYKICEQPGTFPRDIKYGVIMTKNQSYTVLRDVMNHGTFFAARDVIIRDAITSHHYDVYCRSVEPSKKIARDVNC
jgi:predicted GTPase